jgi:hypothetical protein
MLREPDAQPRVRPGYRCDGATRPLGTVLNAPSGTHRWTRPLDSPSRGSALPSGRLVSRETEGGAARRFASVRPGSTSARRAAMSEAPARPCRRASLFHVKPTEECPWVLPNPMPETSLWARSTHDTVATRFAAGTRTREPTSPGRDLSRSGLPRRATTPREARSKRQRTPHRYGVCRHRLARAPKVARIASRKPQIPPGNPETAPKC